jgi:hypothetical protein
MMDIKEGLNAISKYFKELPSELKIILPIIFIAIILLIVKVLPTFSGIAPFIAGFITAIFAEPIRKKLFKPKLKISFGDTLDYLTETPETGGGRTIDTYYIRAKVTNEKKIIARSCKVFLINIEEKDEYGKFLSTIYCDSIQLAWSCQDYTKGEQWQGIDLAKGVNQYVDLITTRSINESFDPQLKVKPLRYLDLFRKSGAYRFTIQVCGSDADPEIIKLVFEWNGVWNKFKIYEDKSV